MSQVFLAASSPGLNKFLLCDGVSDFAPHSIEENFPVFQEFFACNNASSFPVAIINLSFHSYEKCCSRVFLESILLFIGPACHETRSGGPYMLILGGCKCSFLHWYTWQWNTENLGAQNINGRQFQVKEEVPFHAGVLRDVFVEICKYGDRLWGRLLSWVSSPHTCNIQALPFAPRNDVLLPHLHWGAGQLCWFSFSVTLKRGVWGSLKPCQAQLLVLSHHPMASMVLWTTLKEGKLWNKINFFRQ